ncbi:MAG: Tol-Pal system beta propeller repeat protein TolB [Gammaproteobacteria bacterium]|nr:Tol-Pal system beta propeller repeat protein TolB [Gammaproteobacteria bacterium]
MNVVKYLSGLLLAVLPILPLPLPAQGELVIVIDTGVEKTLPIAVVPFGWDGPADGPPLDMHVTIANNLERSGRFAAMAAPEMPQQPAQFEHVNFRDWRMLRMEHIVIGSLKQTAAGDFEVVFRLLDAYKQTQLSGFNIRATGAQLRRVAHRISDIIFEKLTGVRGAFDTRIAYVTVREGADGDQRFSLQIADADGFNPQTLLKSEQALMSPAWSPDGQYLAYVSFEGDNSSVFVQNVRTGERRQVAAHEGINSAPAFSPDGTRLALTLSKEGNPEIFVLHLSDNSLQRITRNRAIDTEPAWSPDGSKLAFTSDRGGAPQVYQIDLQGGAPSRLTFAGNYFARPRYAPDGAGMTMVYEQDGAYRIAYLDLDNGALSVLTSNRLDESPSFSPNGSMIIYATNGRYGSELAAVSADGRVHQRLALQDGEVREPAWGPFPAD